MKRYLVFLGENYYPSGGMDDFLNDFDTPEECKKAIRESLAEGFDPRWESLEEYISKQYKSSWGHVYDTETRKEVWCLSS